MDNPKDPNLGELPDQTPENPFPYMASLGIMVGILYQMQDAMLQKDSIRFQALRKDLHQMIDFCELGNNLRLGPRKLD